jgi:hypothetical protein
MVRPILCFVIVVLLILFVCSLSDININRQRANPPSLAADQCLGSGITLREERLNRRAKPLTKDDVQYVVSFDDNPYMAWQAEVMLYNFQKLGLSNQLWFSILYPDRQPSNDARRLASLHPNVRFYYNDAPRWREYKAVCKSYGVAKLLDDPQIDRSMGDCVMVLDPDVLLDHLIPFTEEMLQDECIYGSDTASYLSFNHFHRDRDVSKEHMTQLCSLVGESNRVLSGYERAESTHSVIGAQYLFKDVDAAFFYKIAQDAWKLYQYATLIAKEGNKCQVWCMGDMLSFLLNSIQRVGVERVRVPQDAILDFTWATNSIEEYGKYAIVHMAGVTEESHQFNKQLYSQKPPWDPTMQDFDYITNTQTCAQKWLDLCQEYAWFRYQIRMIIPA